ncbi:uncharacterized protein LOC136064079 [Quercus suber]|uniref:uncharacterized protein LOC136064079 n=1 Tax=Quercus suber TaxID=58331 RepID=UPI0032DFA569
MAEPGQQPAESRASQHIDHFLNLEQRHDLEGSVHTTHPERSQPHGGSHISHAKKSNMHLEIERLRRELRLAKRKRISSHSDEDWGDEQDVTYEQRSQTPISESFSYEEEHRRKRQPQSPSRGGVGNDAMNLDEGVRCEDLVKVLIRDDPERFFQVESQIPQPEKEELIEFLKRNLDVFVWNAYEALRVDPEFICHHLRVNPLIIPKKQPPRRPFKEHADAVKEEVTKLKQAGAIKEVFYLEWLANTVVVKKKSGKWRVYLVDATVSHPRISFLDVFQGYHQIPLAPDDQEKTAFVTLTGSTYQRMMTRMFESQLGKSIEVYIDDMVVKSKVIPEHVKDLDNTFEILRRHKLHLNASKYSFGVGLGKFLGYMVTHRGIEVNPDQIKAIQNLQPPRNPKEVQKLTGMTAALNRFISQSTDRCKPFFSLINKWKGIEWTEECASAFQQLKDYLARLPIMSSPEPDEVLFAYIAVVPYAIRYLPLEKAILAVVLRTQKLPYYFQAHTVIVLTQLPLKFVLRNADYTGRIAKWGTILGAFNIKYLPRTSIKGQIVADLVAEFTKPGLEEVKAKKDMDEKSRFVWKNIITRFGVPHTLISDNGLQFDSKAFRKYCSELGIMNRYSTLAYPQGNGQAESVNKVIVNGLKKRLDNTKGKSTGETPFSMTYGAEAVIPLETGFPTLETSSFSLTSNDELLERSLDLIEERKENAMVRLAHYQQKLRQGYDANVKLKPLEPSDLVLRKVVGTAKNPTWGKLGPNWERPYRITSGAGIGAYFLEDLDSHVIPRPWNVNNFKRYYY